MTYTRTTKATAAAAKARSEAAAERKLREAATLLHLHGWFLADPDNAPVIRGASLVTPEGATRQASLEWGPGDRVR